MASETSRMESFSDGVLAIAITLLIFQIKVPPVTQEQFGTQLLEQPPSMLFLVELPSHRHHVGQPSLFVRIHQAHEQRTAVLKSTGSQTQHQRVKRGMPPVTPSGLSPSRRDTLSYYSHSQRSAPKNPLQPLS